MHIKRIPNSHVFGNAPVEYNPDDNWWIFRITRYSVVHDKHTNWCITYKKMLDVYKFKMYIPFNNKQEIINFINYTQTIFCMGCLYLKKNSLNIARL